MSVSHLAVRDVAASDVAATAAAMTSALDRLQASIAGQLRRTGIELPDAELADLSDGILNEAVRVALLWLGEHGG